MHEIRKAEKSLKESNLSLLKTLGPDKRELFTTLSTTNMELEPTMSEIHGDPHNDQNTPEGNWATEGS